MEPGTLTKLLGSSSENLLFNTSFQVAQPPVVVPKETPNTQPEENRVIFIGNVSIECKKKQIKRLMEQFGEVEKVWRRSIPVDRGKLPITAAVALKKFITGNDCCNFYVLFKTEEEARKSLKMNGQEFKGKHLRVDLANKPEKNTENSVFVGGLPFNLKDEELWQEFQEFGSIKYVRIPRSPDTFLGKGFGYVCFNEKKSAKRAMAKNGAAINGRTIRVSKAVEPGSEKTQKIRERRPQGRKFVPEEPVQKPRGISSLKGTKKIVRKEQIKLQKKRELKKEEKEKEKKKKKKVE